MVSPHDKSIMGLRPAGSDPRDAGGNGESPEVRATASVRGSSIAASMSRRRGWLILSHLTPAPFPGVTAHGNAISYEGARNAGKVSLRRRMCLLGMAPEQAFHDHEGFSPMRYKPFVIMEKS